MLASHALQLRTHWKRVDASLRLSSAGWPSVGGFALQTTCAMGAAGVAGKWPESGCRLNAAAASTACHCHVLTPWRGADLSHDSWAVRSSSLELVLPRAAAAAAAGLGPSQYDAPSTSVPAWAPPLLLPGRANRSAGSSTQLLRLAACCCQACMQAHACCCLTSVNVGNRLG